MWLSDITLPLPYGDCRGLALVYDYNVAVTLYELQQAYGDPRHIPTGRPLTDGRWMMYGDVLSEVGSGGILAKAFSHITPEMMSQVEVVPLEVAKALLPQEPA
jgi:hypothetical protein